MSDFQDSTGLSTGDSSGEQNEAASNIFLNMAQTDSTGIPSLKQAPVSAISSSVSDSKVSVQLLIAMFVVAIGAGAVYGMRYIGTRAGLDKEIVSIDYASQADSADFSKRFNTVLKTLDESSVSIQIADHDSFAKTPFSREAIVDEAPQVRVDPGMSEEERLAAQRKYELEQEIALRKQRVLDEASRFKLQGIIGGSRPAARISGLPVRAGMDLGDYFTVKEINGRTVIIEADGMEFELAIGQEPVQIN